MKDTRTSSTSYAWGPKPGIPPFIHFVPYFCLYIIFQKSGDQFFDRGSKGSKGVKSALTFEKWPLVAELKLKM